MDTQQNQLVKRSVIIGMHQSGKSITEIAFKMGVCRNVVSKWINRWEEADLRDLPRSGCLRKTSQEEDQAIITEANRNSLTNAVIIKKHSLNIDASVYTVRRRLHDGGLHRYTPERKKERKKYIYWHISFTLQYLKMYYTKK